MKTILSMAALALIMASCSSEDDNVVINNGNLPQEIKIYQSVQGLPSKAAIGPGDKVSAMILTNDGGDAFTGFTPRLKNTLTAENTFANATDRANATVGTFIANATTGQAITLSTKLYYSTEASTGVYVMGIAPNGDIENGTVKFSQDGLQDLMYAAPVSAGSENSHTTPIVLDFAHKTTQLKFAAKITRVGGGEWNGAAVSIQSIQIHKAELPLSMNIADGAVNWVTPVDHFSVPMSNTSPLTDKVPADVSQPVMMKNGTNITIDVTMRVGSEDKTFTSLPVMKDDSTPLTTLIGNSHLVTLNITEPTAASGVDPIKPTATVQDWISGDAGSVEIK